MVSQANTRLKFWSVSDTLEIVFPNPTYVCVSGVVIKKGEGAALVVPGCRRDGCLTYSIGRA